MAEENEVGKMNIDQALELLTSSSHGIFKCWDDYVKEEYGSSYAENRNDLIDIITVVDYVVENLKDGKTDDFKVFFQNVEKVLDEGDDSSKELIIVGILEGLQNNCGLENVDYHRVFDAWLCPKSKKSWDGLIYLWESNDSIEEKQQKLKDYRV